MPKYLIEASYTTEGAKGLLKDGGTKRRQAAERPHEEAVDVVDRRHDAVGGVGAQHVAEDPDHDHPDDERRRELDHPCDEEHALGLPTGSSLHTRGGSAG